MSKAVESHALQVDGGGQELAGVPYWIYCLGPVFFKELFLVQPRWCPHLVPPLGGFSPGEPKACKPQSWCCRMRARGPAEQASSRFRDFLQTQRWMPRNRFFLKMNHSEMHKENPFALNRQIMFLTGALLQVNLL